MIALTTGMRRGEILGLKRGHIKTDSRFLILPVTKNNTVRILPINDILLRTLQEIPHNSEYLFGNGKHLGDIRRSFGTACESAGIRDFRFHDLRHTYASHLAMRGIHIRALQELLGHKDVKMTQRYSHLSPDQLQGAVKLIDDIIPRRELDTILTPKPKKEKGVIANPLNLLVGDAGVEPTAFGSGDQRSILLS
jgi:integrase